MGWYHQSFDDSVHGAHGGAGFVIRDNDGRFLAAEEISLHNPSIPEVEREAAWTDIIQAIRYLHVHGILIERLFYCY